jgi:hypothetical protein
VIEIDDDVSRKITKMSLVIYAILFFLSPAQPLLCSTLMGLAALAPILLGPNPLRVLGLLAFAMAGYLFWPEYQESKKIPTRNEVRQALARAEPMKAAVAQYVAEQYRLPGEDVPDVKAPNDDKAAFEVLPGGAIRVQLKFAPLAGQSVRWVPALVGTAVPSASPVPSVTPVAPADAAPSSGAQAAAPAPVPARPSGPPPKLSWSCISDDIAQSYLPGNCRNSENLRRAAELKKR